MQKKGQAGFDTRTLVFLAALVAMHIVLTRLLVIDLGFARVTLGSVCTILAGLWFGPMGGGVCGLASDLLGCLIKGYAVNPLITAAAILWGVIPAILYSKAHGSKGRRTAFLCVSVVTAAVISSLLLTTTGLVLMNGYRLAAIFPSRLIQFAVMTPVYCVVTCAVYYSPLTGVIRSMAVRQET